MNTNVGTLDRNLHIGTGLALIGLSAIGTVDPWGWIGIVPLATGVLRWCPAYIPFGIKTCKTA